MKELNEYRHFMKKEEMHKSLNSLVGILEGISADGAISIEEAAELQQWYELHRHLLNTHPFSQIFPIIDAALTDGSLDIEEAKDILWVCNKFSDLSEGDLYFDAITSKIQQLQGMVHGMIADGKLSDSEIKQLNEWLNDNDFLSGTYPFDEIYSLLLAAKDDGTISEDERNMLIAFFTNFIDTKESCNIHEVDARKLRELYSIQGICAVCPEISFDGTTFCFTGASTRGTRAEIAKIVESKGSHFTNGVTQKTDYLIVGGDGNPCWAFSCYGRKVEKAMDLRKAGYKVVIVHENDFWDEV